MTRPRTTWWVAALLPLVAACGGGDGGSSGPPVFTVTPVDLTGPYDAGTATYGGVRFEAPVVVPFGADLGSHDSPAIEYITVPGAVVRACAPGRVQAVEFDAGPGDWEVRVAFDERWLVVYDHVLAVAVSVGDDVAAGTPLGTAGTWSATAGRTELQINDEDAGVALCPLDFGNADFLARHEGLRAAVDASAFGPLPSLCVADSVVP